MEVIYIPSYLTLPHNQLLLLGVMLRRLLLPQQPDGEVLQGGPEARR